MSQKKWLLPKLAWITRILFPALPEVVLSLGEAGGVGPDQVGEVGLVGAPLQLLPVELGDCHVVRAPAAVQVDPEVDNW